jgi:hypothetical protein
MPSQKKYVSLALLLVLLAVAAFIGIVYSNNKPSVIVDNGFLTVKSLFYGKNISIEEINVDGIKQLNLNDNWDYNIKIRTNGIGLPNCYLGWMQLNNGKKALVYLTDRTDVTLIPTNGYDVLINSVDFNGIKEMLQKTIN